METETMVEEASTSGVRWDFDEGAPIVLGEEEGDGDARGLLVDEPAPKPGSLNILSMKYESLDYDTCDNVLLLEEERNKGYKGLVGKLIAKWIVFLFIGMVTALIACAIDISIDWVCHYKYSALSYSVDDHVLKGQLYVPYLYWVLYNVIPVLIGSVAVAYLEPVAAGSGIPQVKCYLNGVKVPRIVRIRTLFVKAIGVVCSVVGGLAGGKEGPMIHVGAAVAAGISQGKSTTFGFDLKILKYFRADQEKRDFVSGGAASGVSAAFGAPIGGVLFSLEEGASFWNQSLTWMIFFASVVSTFTLNLVLSLYYGEPGNLQFPGLLNLGHFDGFTYELYELPVFALVGAIGGLLGAFWNSINYKLTVFRIRYLRKRWMKVIEACLVATMTATVGFLMIYFLNDCKPLGQDPTKFPTQMNCNDGEYNVLASIWFQTPEASVRSLFHDPPNTHNVTSLICFVLFYFFLSCWTFGLATSNGLFIPSLLTGAAWGRLVANCLYHIYPDNALVHPGKYALIGAAAQLGGLVRMTISLTVIIMETTENISFGLPLIVTLIAAKWTGDFFNEGIYDIHIQLSGIPFLPWEPPPLTKTSATGVMSHPVVTLNIVENVGHIVDLLKQTTYNGFPVVDPPSVDEMSLKYGKLRGLILRSQLIVILQKKFFNEPLDGEGEINWKTISANDFRDEYPLCKTINEIELTDRERTFSIDLRPFMNRSPYSILHLTSMSRMFRLFRALGLRHLPVVNDSNEVIGMVTRKDLARFREWRHLGTAGRPPWYNSAGQQVEPFVIGICGGSASGKTTVAAKIIEYLGVPWVTLLSMDSFYKVLNEKQRELSARNEYNFDHPDAFDFDLLSETLQRLKEGRKIEVPIYNFVTHSREARTKTMYGANVIIFEGILTFYNKQVLDMLDMKIFVDTDADIRLARRLKRDISQRGRDLEGVLKQYTGMVQPSFNHYIAPLMAHADIIVPRGGENEVAIQLIVQHVHTQLHARGFKLREELAQTQNYVGQPRPDTVRLLPTTPQIRGLHTFIRNKDTPRDEFIFYSKRLIRLVIEYTLSLMNFVEKTVETPQGVCYKGKRMETNKICGVSILRAGETMEQAFSDVCKDIRIGKILIQTNFHTGEPELFYLRLPKDIKDFKVILMDATVATGAAAMMAIRVLLDHDVAESNILIVSLLMAESGVHSIAYAFPKVQIVTTAVDPEINDKFYVLPGIGNFGDRYFGTEPSDEC